MIILFRKIYTAYETLLYQLSNINGVLGPSLKICMNCLSTFSDIKSEN